MELIYQRKGVGDFLDKVWFTQFALSYNMDFFEGDTDSAGNLGALQH